VLRSWQRNFRYRVARWGYSPAVLGWELFNEHGHVAVGSNLYGFYQSYGAYQRATDPYGHLRTTSQGSQAFSPALWSSGAFDAANYHDYLMPGRYPASLVDDEAAFVYRYAWCLRAPGRYCGGLAGDGSAWSGGPKPVVWGEIGVGTSAWDQPNPAGTRGEGGRRALHNQMWAGLLSPIGTTPIDWYWQQEDAVATGAKFAERRAAAAFFAGVDYAGGRFVHLMTAADAPSGYAGETVAASSSALRAYAMRRADGAAAYLWVQHRDHTWATAPAVPSPVSGTVTIGGLASRPYTVEVWSTDTDAILSTGTVTPTAGAVAVPISNLSDDLAVKIEAR
jgi:hypothetical protein